MSPTSARAHNSSSLTVAAGLLTFTLVVAILYFAKEVLVPVALAIMLAFVLNPMVMLLQKWRLGRVPAVLATVGLAALLIGSLILLVSVQLNNLVNDLPRYQTNIQTKIASLREASHDSALNRIRTRIHDIFQDHNSEASQDLKKSQVVTQQRIPATDPSDEGVFTKVFGPLKAAVPALDGLAKFLFALILAIFMLIRREDLRNRLVSFASAGSLTTTTRAIDDAGDRISRYMVMQLIINGSFGLAVGLGLYFIGIPYALLWGLCAAVLRYIPYVGAWIAAAPPLAVSFMTSTTWTGMLLVFGLFLVLELVTGNVMEPWLYGQGTGVSEVALLVCAAFWAWLWGSVGLMLATPLTVCVVVAGKYVPSLAFFDRLLGDRPALKPYTAFLQRLLARDPLEASTVVEEYRKQNSPESVYDGLFVPALGLTRQDRASGVMTADDEQYIVREMTALVHQMSPLAKESKPHAAGTASAKKMTTRFNDLKSDSESSQVTPDWSDPETPVDPTIQVFGFPAHDGVEECTLVMLDQLVRPLGLSVKVFSTKTLPSEMIDQVERQHAAVVIIAALPPGGLPQASFLCESLRERFPELTIVVGHWGSETNLDETILGFRSAGASYVTTTLLGARNRIASIQSSSSAPTTVGSTHATKPVVGVIP